MKNYLLTSFRSFKDSMVPETTLCRRKSIAFIKMFKRAGMRVIAVIIFCVFAQSLKAQSQWETESQAKPKTVKKDTAKYEYYIKVSARDYQQLLNLAVNYRNSTTYNPTMQPNEKLNEQAGIDRYLFSLSKRVKLDSLKVK